MNLGILENKTLEEIKEILISNIPKGTNKDTKKDLISLIGKIISIKLITPKEIRNATSNITRPFRRNYH